MKKLLLVVIAVLGFNHIPMVFADEAAAGADAPLPEIAPTEDPAIPALDAPAKE